MKRLLLLLSTGALLFSLCACQGKSSPSSETPPDTAAQTSLANVTESPKSTYETPSSTKKAPTDKPKTTAKPTTKAPTTKHVHRYTAEKVAGTCQEQGYTLYRCACGHTYKDDYVNGEHQYVSFRCSVCGKADVSHLHDLLKNWVLEHGSVSGNNVAYYESANKFGGPDNSNFMLFYLNSGNGSLDFSLHTPVDADYSFSASIYIPQDFSGNYTYIASYYHGETSTAICQSIGTLNGKDFTRNYPLNSSSYEGPMDQNTFLELSREYICSLLDCIGRFLEQENLGCTLSDIGFTAFS